MGSLRSKGTFPKRRHFTPVYVFPCGPEPNSGTSFRHSNFLQTMYKAQESLKYFFFYHQASAKKKTEWFMNLLLRSSLWIFLCQWTPRVDLIYFIIFQLRYNSYSIKVTQSVQFSVFWYIHKLVQLSSNHCCLIPECSQHAQNKPTAFQQSLYPCPQTSRPLFLATTTNLPSVSMDLPILDILYKCSHTICDFLCLPPFTQHSDFKVYPFCRIEPILHSFFDSIFHHMDIPHLFIHSSVEGHLGCFHFFSHCE